MSGIDTPMIFEQLRDSIIALLAANQTGRFVTVGNQKQSTDATEVNGILRTVQVFYSQGDYPKNKSSQGSPSHDMTFQIVYTASSPSKGDKSVLEDDNSTESHVQAALLAVQEGESLVDQSIDELRRMVTQILMDPANEDFGLEVGVVSDPWLQNFQKTAPVEHGRLVVLKASETFTANVDETLTGLTPIEASDNAFSVDYDPRPADGNLTDPSPKAETLTDN